MTPSLLCRGSNRVLFSGGVDALSNLSAGTELQRQRKAREPLPETTPKMAAIRGRQFSVHYSLGWLAWPCVTVKMAGKS